MQESVAVGHFRLRLLDEQNMRAVRIFKSGSDLEGMIRICCEDGHIFVHRCLLQSDSNFYKEKCEKGGLLAILQLSTVKVKIAEKVLRIIYQGFTLLEPGEKDDAVTLIKYLGLRSLEEEKAGLDEISSSAMLAHVTRNNIGNLVLIQDSVDVQDQLQTQSITDLILLKDNQIIKDNFQKAMQLNEVYVPVKEPINVIATNSTSTYKESQLPLSLSTLLESLKEEYADIPMKPTPSVSGSSASSSRFSTASTKSASSSVNPYQPGYPDFRKVGPESKPTKMARVESRQGSSIKFPTDGAVGQSNRIVFNRNSSPVVSVEHLPPVFRKIPHESLPSRATRRLPPQTSKK